MAIGDIGKAEIEVVADTSHFPESAKRGVESSLHDVDPSLKKAGEEWGETTSESFGERLKARVPKIVDDFTGALKREKIKEKVKVDVDADVDRNSVRNFVRKLATSMEREVESASSGGGGAGGIFNKIGQSFADAIGAGFNVSGKSPLIALLVPVIGGIAGLILAAVEAVYGLAAALFTLPSILAAIIAQVGVMFLIFKAVAPVIGAVLSAQNAKELREALMGVNPAIAEFAKSLIPIRDFFELLGKTAAVEFFQALGNTVKDIFNADNRTLFFGLLEVAKALGGWFATIGKAFSSTAFVKFLGDLFKSIDNFLAHNGPIFEKFLEQAFIFLDKMLDPANALGALFNLLFINFGNWLEEMSKDPKFLDWLENKMPILLLDLGEALGAIIDLITTLFNDIDKKGGQNFLESFTIAVKELNAIFESEAGQLAIQALIQIIEVLSLTFFGLIVVIVSVLAFLEKLGQGVIWLGKQVGDFFSFLWDHIGKLFSGEFWLGLLRQVADVFQVLIDRAPGWGAKLVQGFIDGALSKIPGVRAAFHFIADQAAQFMPHSPAKAGPLSGSGAPYARGTAMIRDFSRGIMATGDQVSMATSNAMSNVNFGTGAVIANFYGAQPTQDQAQNLGTAVGNGIGDQLLARNVRLAVRTM